MRKILRRLARLILILLLLFAAAWFIFSSMSTRVSDYDDSFVYELPVAPGFRSHIAQGYGGLFTHRHIAALDFEMPSGTPIYAARGGEIYSYKDDSNEGGVLSRYRRKANYIMIRHDDGSYGCYWHLKQYGVVVKKGKVKKGQLIGYSGATGQVLRSHLHFSVKRRLNYERNSFVKTKFRTTNGVEQLKQGKTYQRPD